MTTVTPVKIQVALACYYSKTPEETFPESVWNSPAFIEARSWLRNQDVIDLHNEITERGEVWIKGLLALSLPIAITTWVFPDVKQTS